MREANTARHQRDAGSHLEARTPRFLTGSLVLLTFAVYYQVWNFEFVDFDDAMYVFDNDHVKSGLRIENIIWAWSWDSTHVGIWHPLTWLSLLVDAEIYGEFAGGFHVTNVVLHTLNVLLLYLWLKELTGQIWPSAFVAMVFAVHPLHVESVAWVAERKDVLSTFFGLLCLRGYTRYTLQPGWPRYCAVLLCFVASLISKPMLVTMPILLLLLDYWPLKRVSTSFFATAGSSAGGPRPVTRLVIEKIPLFLISAGFSIVAVLAQRSAGAMVGLEEHSLTERLANAGVSYLKYLEMTIWPQSLAAFYPIPKSYSTGLVFVAWGILGLISVMCIVCRRRYPFLLVGWAWYVVTLMPVIGLFKVGWQAMADRYTYIPSIGLFVAVGWMGSRLSCDRRIVRTGLQIASCACLLAWAIVAWNQTAYWRNSLTLVRRTVAATINNQRAHTQLAFLLSQQGDFAAAEVHLNEALNIDPADMTIRNNLACMLAQEGRYAEAASHFEEILRQTPQHAPTLLNLAAVYARQDRLNESAELYRKIIALNPDDVEARYLLIQAMTQLGQYDAAQDQRRDLERRYKGQLTGAE